MKWVEKIGVALGLIGMVCVLFGGGRFVQDTATELTNTIGECGILLAVVGLLMVNFKSDWLFRE